MSIAERVIARAKKDFHKWQYRQASSGILQTPPLQPGHMPFMLLSMVHQRDVLSYLVALKSFTRYANPQKIVVVCDPTINAEDRKILQTHVPHIELRHADEFTHPDIPRGGCWERLCAISHYTKGNYVVQLDADTLTIGSIDNVVNAIANKAGFVLGEEPSQCLLSLAQVSANGPTEH